MDRREFLKAMAAGAAVVLAEFPLEAEALQDGVTLIEDEVLVVSEDGKTAFWSNMPYPPYNDHMR